MAQAVDLTPAVLGEDGVTLMPGKAMHLGITMLYDHQLEIVRIKVTDPTSENYADRTVTNGMIHVGDGVKMPIKAIYDMIPSAIEEIVVMNRLLGHAVKDRPEPDDE
jgi:hypothetical protein